MLAGSSIYTDPPHVVCTGTDCMSVLSACLTACRKKVTDLSVQSNM